MIAQAPNTTPFWRRVTEKIDERFAQLMRLQGSDGRPATILVLFAGGGSAITTSAKPVPVKIDFDCRVVSWTVLADQTGSIVVDVKKATYSGFPTTASIAGTDKPTLSSARKATSTALTGWTKDIADGDVLEFSVSSAATVELVTVELRVRKT